MSSKVRAPLLQAVAARYLGLECHLILRNSRHLADSGGQMRPPSARLLADACSIAQCEAHRTYAGSRRCCRRCCACTTGATPCHDDPLVPTLAPADPGLVGNLLVERLIGAHVWQVRLAVILCGTCMAWPVRWHIPNMPSRHCSFPPALRTNHFFFLRSLVSAGDQRGVWAAWRRGAGRAPGAAAAGGGAQPLCHPCGRQQPAGRVGVSEWACLLVGGLKDPLHGSTAVALPSKPSSAVQPRSQRGARPLRH